MYALQTGETYEAAKAPYTDFGNYDAETIYAISMLYELDIATGFEGEFNPKDSTTRGQAAKIFMNFLESIKTRNN
ncbi:MAG: S-layer homology domain-containing protein [Solibacillus sp.]